MSVDDIQLSKSASLLWQPKDPTNTPTWRLLELVNARHGQHLTNYKDLYRWSTSNLNTFWSLVWDTTSIIGDKGTPPFIDESASPADNPTWFPTARLNYAENLLRHCSLTPNKVALIQATEPTPEFPDVELRQVTYAELYEQVHRAVRALQKFDLKPGDRVASYASNCIENVVACLAATALGCIWVSAAADFGPDGVFERFEQVRPSVIFVVDAVVYNGRLHDHTAKVQTLLSKLSTTTTTSAPAPHIIVIHPIPHASTVTPSSWTSWPTFLQSTPPPPTGTLIPFIQLPFDHPLWILFSSGTTGRPKAIVHRAGGMLLQATKELSLCAGLTASDVFFYYTTTGWMMWNFLVGGGLAVGCTLVLFDGSPLREPKLLWELTDRLGITIFGTSAKYLDALSKKYTPRTHHTLTSLRHIYSTGSPLSPALFDYVYDSIKRDVLLGSITGGTDICSLFAGMNAMLPVYRGEIQCRMLGMAVEAYVEGGGGAVVGVDIEGEGELVCLKPFPCEPLGFWPLPGYGSDEDVAVAAERFRKAYFAEYPNIWYHGDHIAITESQQHNGGGIVMLGRSDGVLNPGGVRFGTAEIYDVLDAHFSAEIVDYVAVGRSVSDGTSTDEEVVLFLKLPPGDTLESTLDARIRSEIRKARSARHVPAKIIQTDEIPYTLNGKRVEVLLKKILNGARLGDVNASTLQNPGCLEFYARLRETLV
ncbi:acetoacetyl-CoA synthetase [Auriculariales sp. MPI-PUGE-AT-0066]|nr:acetoacetyl-CoA synthetase [Auriculariales sp. MPI-PUGE-AT-0066]